MLAPGLRAVDTVNVSRENQSARLLQDFSSLLASLLPILQLFFIKLPDAVTQIFLSPKYFTGVSIVTLILSYVAIIAYQSKPWFVITAPFQKEKIEKYNDYVRQLNEASAANNFIAGEQASPTKLNNFLKKLTAKPVSTPRQVTQDNVISVCVLVVFINAIAFVVIGQLKPNIVLSIIQSINYVFLIVFSALVLTVYHRISTNNKEWDEDQRARTDKAIDLAIHANCFGQLPQVRLISSFDDNNLPSNYHVWVEHENQKYEIITDIKAQKIIAVYPFE